MTESFEDAIKALRHIARGNGSVMRIADRIVAAHERETKVEGVCGPITGELRDMVSRFDNFNGDEVVTMHGADFDRRCDAIDSIHAQLEREYEDLRMKFVNANRHAQHVERENESLKAENVRLLHVIGECTGQLREKHELGYIVMPMGAAQALCETVAEIVGKRYDMTDEGVEFDD